MNSDWLDNKDSDELSLKQKFNAAILEEVTDKWDEHQDGIYLAELGNNLRLEFDNYNAILDGRSLLNYINSYIGSLRTVRDTKNKMRIKLIPAAGSEDFNDEDFFTETNPETIPFFDSSFWNAFAKSTGRGEKRFVLQDSESNDSFLIAYGDFKRRSGQKVYEISSDYIADSSKSRSKFPHYVYQRITSWLQENDLDEALFLEATRETPSEVVVKVSKLERIIKILGSDVSKVKIPIDLALKLASETDE